MVLKQLRVLCLLKCGEAIAEFVLLSFLVQWAFKSVNMAGLYWENASLPFCIGLR